MGSKNSQKIASMWTYYYIAEHSVCRGQYNCRISGFQILLYGIINHTYTVYVYPHSATYSDCYDAMPMSYDAISCMVS
jgi:hypothetical protein